MFSFFKKKEPSVKVIDKIWMTETAKLNGCLSILKQNPNTVFVAWFSETYDKLNNFLALHSYNNSVAMYRDVHGVNKQDLVFAEHYPTLQKEQSFFLELGLQQAIVLTALDEPLMQFFGGDRINEVMKRMGMADDEMIEHNMIASSIQRAQKKIEESITMDNTASSQKEWFARNLNK